MRMMEKGRYEVVRIGGQVFRRGTYEPGWRSSEHVAPSVGARCGVEHLGLVLAGRATAAFDDGMTTELRQGQRFSTFRRCRTTAGWWETSLMSPYTSLARTDTQIGRASCRERV